MIHAHWFADAVVVLTLISAAITDVWRGRIYNWQTYPAALLGVAIWLTAGASSGGWAGLGEQAWRLGASFLVVFVPMLIAFAAGGIGGGDTKLAGAAALCFASWQLSVTALAYGFLVGGLIAVYVMIRGRLVGRTLGRVWQFLRLLAIRARPASPSDAASPKIPFGLGLCIGGVWALVEWRIFDGVTLLDRLVGR